MWILENEKIYLQNTLDLMTLTNFKSICANKSFQIPEKSRVLKSWEVDSEVKLNLMQDRSCIWTLLEEKKIVI